MSPRRLGVGAGLLLLATLALGALGGAGEHASPWRVAPGIDFAFGLAGCVAIVLVSKALGRAGLQRPEGWDEPRDGGAE